MPFMACTKLMPTSKDDSGPPVIEQTESRAGILEVTAEIDKSNATISISKIPGNTNLKCELDHKELDKCHDGMVLKNLKDGEYLLHVIASMQDKTLSVGEVYFTIGAKESVNVERVASELELDIGSGFNLGGPFRHDLDVKVPFKLLKKNSCNPKFECSYGDKDAAFWRDCSANDHHIIKGAIGAKGLQYLSVRASCPDKLGPVLSVHWYGVDDRYFKGGSPQELTLDFIHNRGEDKYIFHLMKANDCPENLLKLECKTGSSDYATCTHIHEKPPADFKIRAVCESKKGPALGMDVLNGT